MLCRKGWNIVYDTDSKRMIPFFTYVRSSDIVPTNPVDITTALVHTSTRWNEVRVEDSTGVTIYYYQANWDFPTDPNNEQVGSNSFDGELMYRMYKDGRMEIEGEMRVARADTNAEGLSEYYVYLPFAFPEDTPKVGVEWIYGSTPDMAMAGTVASAQITNMQLNPTLSTEEYPFLLKYYILPTTTDMPSFDTLRHLVEYGDLKNLTLDDYMDKLPVKVSYQGWWRDPMTVDIDAATNQDASYVGLYRTTGMVTMISRPDELTGVSIRPLKKGITISCGGFYSVADDGVVWLLVTYTGTGEQGYVKTDMLERL